MVVSVDIMVDTTVDTKVASNTTKQHIVATTNKKLYSGNRMVNYKTLPHSERLMANSKHQLTGSNNSQLRLQEKMSKFLVLVENLSKEFTDLGLLSVIKPLEATVDQHLVSVSKPLEATEGQHLVSVSSNKIQLRSVKKPNRCLVLLVNLKQVSKPVDSTELQGPVVETGELL